MRRAPILKQECPLAFVVLAWLLYVGGLVTLAVVREWAMLAVWFVVAPVTMWAYIRWFPALSPFMGYGSVDDRPGVIARAPREVTLYTALGCPFCPIVKRRLEALEPAMGFRLREVDVTARPDILTRKGVWSVPVTEVEDMRLVGHATSEQLANLISGRVAAAAPAA